MPNDRMGADFTWIRQQENERVERRRRDYEQAIQAIQQRANIRFEGSWVNTPVSAQDMNANLEQVMENIAQATAEHEIERGQAYYDASTSPLVYGETTPSLAVPIQPRAAWSVDGIGMVQSSGHSYSVSALMVEVSYDEKYLKFKEIVTVLGINTEHLGGDFSWGDFVCKKMNEQLVIIEGLLQCSSCRTFYERHKVKYMEGKKGVVIL